MWRVRRSSNSINSYTKHHSYEYGFTSDQYLSSYKFVFLWFEKQNIYYLVCKISSYRYVIIHMFTLIRSSFTSLIFKSVSPNFKYLIFSNTLHFYPPWQFIYTLLTISNFLTISLFIIIISFRGYINCFICVSMTLINIYGESCMTTIS